MMTRISRDDTQWAIAGNIAAVALEQLVRQLPLELQGDGSKIVIGKEGFAALLAFGGVPNETLARHLLTSVTPVYLLDFDDDASATVKLDRKNGIITETRIAGHPADFLEERGIVAPGYAFIPSPVKSAALIEGVSLTQAKQAAPSHNEFELVEHPRGVLVADGPLGGMLARKLKKRGYLVYRDPEDKAGWFSCVVYEPGCAGASYSPVTPDPNNPPLDSILGETTLEGILRVLAIPPELLGV